jgi:hypothetical protein
VSSNKSQIEQTRRLAARGRPGETCRAGSHLQINEHAIRCFQLGRRCIAGSAIRRGPPACRSIAPVAHFSTSGPLDQQQCQQTYMTRAGWSSSNSLAWGQAVRCGLTQLPMATNIATPRTLLNSALSFSPPFILFIEHRGAAHPSTRVLHVRRQRCLCPAPFFLPLKHLPARIRVHLWDCL